MPAPLRWGVLGGSSRIARNAVIPALTGSDRHEVVAVASRGADGGFASYDELLARPDVEIVYNPLPNGMHREWCERAFAAGKHVLCEKPLGMNEADATAIFAAADEAGCTVVEAYMTPFHPQSELLEGLVQGGRLGDVRSVHASFTFTLDHPDDHRFTRLGDGALLDVGIYCTAPILRWADREPVTVAATARRNEAGVVTTVSAWLDFGEGLTGSFEVSFEQPFRQVLEVVGNRGAVRLGRAFVPGRADTEVNLVQVDGSVETLYCEPGDPYEGLVDHVHAVLRDGVSPRHGRHQTLAVARLLDRVRAATT